MKTHYETERLVLKVLDKSHAPLVLDYYLGNRSFLEEWEPLRDEDFYTIEYQEELLEREMYSFKNGSMLRLWLLKKDERAAGNNRIIGTLGFTNIVRGPFLSCYLGYKLDKDEINHGYMTEALRKGIEIMFQDFGLHRVEANIMPKNKRSLRVAEKLGFYNEGLALKYLKINGKWEDHIHMVLLNDTI